MPSERVQRAIEQMLDAAEHAATSGDWAQVQALCRRALTLDPDSVDARSFLAGAERGLAADSAGSSEYQHPAGGSPAPHPSSPALLPQGEKGDGGAIPTSFDSGRYTVKRFLGEGGQKRVYLAHDTMLDRDVAFALIKTEGLDDIGRNRIKREAQAMGRLGSHPHIVSILDLGEEPILPLRVGSSLPTSLFCSMSGGARGVSGTAREEV